MKIFGAILVALLALASPALAQNPQTVKLCIPTSTTACPAVTASNPLPITGSFSATLAGFTPNGNYGTLTATASTSASTSLPAGTVVAFQNLSSIDVSCVLTAGASTATTNKLIVRAGATVYYTVGSNTTAACINQTGSASNVVGLAGGAGLGTAFGGASAGGGGGGAVTVADGADVTQGALADAAATAGGTGSVSAKLRLMTTQLGTVNTTLGSPFQAGGSIGNTTFAATQATAASLNATVVGTGTFAVQATLAAETTKVIGTVNQGTSPWVNNTSQINGVTPLMGNGVTGTGSQRVTIASDNTAFTVNAAQSGTWNITNISGTITLPTLASTSTKQSDGSQKTQIVDGSGNVIASTSNNLNVQCANCSGSGVSAADAATFTAGTSLFAPVGGQFTSGGATACVTGHECTVGMTAARGIFTDMASIAGTATVTGNGVTGAGSQRVTIASDNTAFSVNATLQASSATAIGTVNPTTAANWGIGTSTQNSASVANGTLILGQFNTTPTTITTGNMSPLQMDNAGNLLVNIKTGSSSGAVAQGSTTSGQTGGLIQAAVTTSAPTYTTAQTNPLSLDTNGSLRVNVTTATGLAQASTTSGQSGSLIMGAVTTASPSYTTAQTSPLSLDTAGSLRVAIISGAGSGGTAIADGATFTEATTSFTPVGGEYVSGGGANCTTGKGCTWQMTIDRMGYVNVGKINAVTVLTGTGAVGTGAQRIAVGTDTATIAGSAPGTAGSASAQVVTVQGVASMTPVAANITQVLGAAISATNGLFTNVLQGNAVLSATNGSFANVLQGNAVLSITNPIFERSVATATGGSTTTGNIVANNTTAVVIKGSAGTLYGVQVYGIGSAPAYLKIYNATSATCGSGTPVKRLMIPAASTAANGAGSNITFGPTGVDFGTGITYCVTTGITDADTSAPAASTFLVNVDYK